MPEGSPRYLMIYRYEFLWVSRFNVIYAIFFYKTHFFINRAGSLLFLWVVWGKLPSIFRSIWEPLCSPLLELPYFRSRKVCSHTDISADFKFIIIKSKIENTIFYSWFSYYFQESHLKLFYTYSQTLCIHTYLCISTRVWLNVLFLNVVGSSPARIPASRTTETVEERITQVSESPKEKVQKPLLYET